MKKMYEDAEEFDVFLDAYQENQNHDSQEIRCTPEDAFLYSLHEKGRIDLKYMAEKSGHSKQELIEDLEGTVMFRKPAAYGNHDLVSGWVTKQQYLSGNLYRKLSEAREWQEKTGQFTANIAFLEQNKPSQIEAEELYIHFGAPFIPTDIIRDFIRSLFRMVSFPKVVYEEYLHRWVVTYPLEPSYVLNNFEYGTSRMSAVNIINHMLNAKTIKIYDRIPRFDRPGDELKLNQDETAAAKERESKIIEEWQQFIQENEERKTQLEERYMEYYGYHISQYDGAFLRLDDLQQFVPYPHQKDAIARCILEKNVLLAHQVGAGKTLEFSAAVHELLRMKLIKKAMLVVTNSTLNAIGEAYKTYFPKDKICVISPKDFVPATRPQTLERLKGDEEQIFILPYSIFDRLGLSYEYENRKLKLEIAKCKLKMDLERNHQIKTYLKSKLEKLKRNLKKWEEEYKDQDTNCFDKLGVDCLVIDEIQNYKNITIQTNMDGVVGLHSVGAKKSDLALKKVRCIQEVGGHVITASGTPITNSLADLYVLQTMLSPQELKISHIDDFNMWTNTFCEQETSFEIDVDSNSFRFKTRFSKFHNIPELMNMCSTFIDFYQIPEGELGLPKFDGFENVKVRRSLEQEEYIHDLVRRTEDIRQRVVKPTEDNLLKVVIDGRKVALDVRLVSDKVANLSCSKVQVCAKKVAEIYFQNPEQTQLIFSDIGVPGEGFNVYEACKKELIGFGVKAEHIAFIHDATTDGKRHKMEKDFNEGKIKILIGSTQKMGTGTNLQTRLLAEHYMDVPWKPSDLEQRTGRMVRQGNLNAKVFGYRYVTEQSFDSFSWQLLERKQTFISQFLSGSLSMVHREEKDCSDLVLDYAEIKALAIGDDRIKERVKLANLLEHARIQQRKRRKELCQLKELLESIPGSIARRKVLLEDTKYDLTYYQHHKQSVPMEERKMFGEELLIALKDNVERPETRIFATYQGFQVVLPKYMKQDKPVVLLQREERKNTYSVIMDGEKALGCCKRLDYVLEHLSERIEEHKKALEDLDRKNKETEKLLDIGNAYDLEVEELTKKLQELDLQLQNLGKEKAS